MGPDTTPQTENNERFRLRIGFPGQAREDACLQQAVIRIGSDDDSDIQLDSGDVALYHASIEYRYRCWMLQVADGAERVHVNARPVRELALLRLGDVISVGGSKLILLQDSGALDGRTGKLADARTEPGSHLAGLRCVAGPLSGRLFLLCPDLQLDRLLLAGMEGCVRVHDTRDGARFEQLGEATMRVSCNGNATKSGTMRNGDQLSWGRHRFVLETSAAPQNRQATAKIRTADPDADPSHGKSDRREMGWLLGVAALLAVCITVLLLLRQ